VAAWQWYRWIEEINAVILVFKSSKSERYSARNPRV
jgi:hypothetical protein